MPITFHCQSCGKRIEVATKHAGIVCPCPKCGVAVTVPGTPPRTRDSRPRSSRSLPLGWVVIGSTLAAVAVIFAMDALGVFGHKAESTEAQAERINKTVEQGIKIENANFQAELNAAKSVSISDVVTKSEYDRIEHGMSYRDVVGIIGVEGEENASGELGGRGIGQIRTVVYSWQNEDGSNMNAMFQNGRLVQKAQFGLP